MLRTLVTGIPFSIAAGCFPLAPIPLSEAPKTHCLTAMPLSKTAPRKLRIGRVCRNDEAVEAFAHQIYEEVIVGETTQETEECREVADRPWFASSPQASEACRSRVHADTPTSPMLSVLDAFVTVCDIGRCLFSASLR